MVGLITALAHQQRNSLLPQTTGAAHPAPGALPPGAAQGRGQEGRGQAVAMVMISTATAHQQTPTSITDICAPGTQDALQRQFVGVSGAPRDPLAPLLSGRCSGGTREVVTPPTARLPATQRRPQLVTERTHLCGRRVDGLVHEQQSPSLSSTHAVRPRGTLQVGTALACGVEQGLHVDVRGEAERSELLQEL